VTATFLSVLVFLSFGGAFVAGLVGVGGAIVTIPLLLYGPPLVGVGRLDVKTVAAVTMVQVFVAAVSGVIVHRRRRAVRPDLAVFGGLAEQTALDEWKDRFQLVCGSGKSHRHDQCSLPRRWDRAVCFL
jgi:hypothetical protein